MTQRDKGTGYRKDRSQNPSGRGRGMGGGRGLGQGGNCACPSCGQTIPHKRGVPCFNEKCPGCGSPMTRQQD